MGFALFRLFHWLGRRNGWSYGPQIGWSFLLTAILTVSGDLWNLFYFNYGRLQSLPLLRAKLAEVHDPDNLGLRVLCELLRRGARSLFRRGNARTASGGVTSAGRAGPTENLPRGGYGARTRRWPNIHGHSPSVA